MQKIELEDSLLGFIPNLTEKRKIVEQRQAMTLEAISNYGSWCKNREDQTRAIYDRKTHVVRLLFTEDYDDLSWKKGHEKFSVSQRKYSLKTGDLLDNPKDEYSIYGHRVTKSEYDFGNYLAQNFINLNEVIDYAKSENEKIRTVISEKDQHLQAEVQTKKKIIEDESQKLELELVLHQLSEDEQIEFMDNQLLGNHEAVSGLAEHFSSNLSAMTMLNDMMGYKPLDDDELRNGLYQNVKTAHLLKNAVELGFVSQEDVEDFILEKSKEKTKEGNRLTITNHEEKSVSTDSQEQLTIYRGIIADDQKTADKWIQSTKTIQATSFGKGMYWTKSPIIAQEYGNYVYSTTISPSDAKKIIDAQDIVLLTADTHKKVSKELVASMDLGINANYKFTDRREWIKPESQGNIWRSEAFLESEIESMKKSELEIPEFLKEKEIPSMMVSDKKKQELAEIIYSHGHVPVLDVESIPAQMYKEAYQLERSEAEKKGILQNDENDYYTFAPHRRIDNEVDKGVLPREIVIEDYANWLERQGFDFEKYQNYSTVQFQAEVQQEINGKSESKTAQENTQQIKTAGQIFIEKTPDEKMNEISDAARDYARAKFKDRYFTVFYNIKTQKFTQSAKGKGDYVKVANVFSNGSFEETKTFEVATTRWYEQNKLKEAQQTAHEDAQEPTQESTEKIENPIKLPKDPVELSNVALDLVKNWSKNPAEMAEYLEFMSKFSDLSPRNIALIHEQWRGANAVATFDQWNGKTENLNKNMPKLLNLKASDIDGVTRTITDKKTGETKTAKFDNLSVRAGEKSQITLLGMNSSRYFEKERGGKIQHHYEKYWSDEDKRKATNHEVEVQQYNKFYPYKVFELSQTNIKPESLPKALPNRHINFEHDEKMSKAMESGLAIYAMSLPNPVPIEKTVAGQKNELGNAHGAYYPNENKIVMNHLNTPSENVATMIHELTHATLHQNSSVGYGSPEYAEQELEAEMTSFVVANHYGLDTKSKAIPYIAKWTKNAQLFDDKELSQSLHKVQHTAKSMIKTLDAHIDPELKKAQKLTQQPTHKTIQHHTQHHTQDVTQQSKIGR